MSQCPVNAFSIVGDQVLLETGWSAPAAARISVNSLQVPLAGNRADTAVLQGQKGDWELSLRLNDTGLLLSVTNMDTVARHLAVVSVCWEPIAFTPPLPSAEFRELVHGGSVLSLVAGVKCVGRKQPPLDFVVPGSLVTAYQRDDGQAVLLGVLPPVSACFSEFTTLHDQPHFEGNFGFRVDFRFECLLDPGKSLETPCLTALREAEGIELLDQYGTLFAAGLTRPVPSRIRIGWNSWDYRAGAVTPGDMDENMQVGDRLFSGALDVFCIDEGWETQWGQWEPNAKFSEGLAAYVSHARECGHTPGIWTAPLLVNTYNPLFYEHPDWFASDAAGQICTENLAYGPMAYLDVTRPEVIDHLSRLFRGLRDLGFEYFKVDFCHCILSAGKFSDPRVGRNQLVRRVFTAIRESIGDEAYLLACGAPYESVVDLVDAVRVTGDIHIYWGHVLRNAAGIATRWWMHGRLWNNDPDFLVVRGPDTASAPFFKRRKILPSGPECGWMAGREFNLEEARAYALLIHLSAGDIILGDRLGLLSSTGLELIRRVLTPLKRPAVPVDLFTSDQDLPRIWIAREADRTVVGLFNWSDKPSRLDFRPENFGISGTATDFWTGEKDVRIPATMPRRSAVGIVYQ